MEQLQTALLALSWQEILAVLFGVFYVILAARENIWCWFWGILSCGFWAYVTLQQYDLWADALLQVFYIVMGFVGWYQWKFARLKDQPSAPQLGISVLSWKQHLSLWAGGLALSLLFGYFFDSYTPAAATYLDSFTTVFAIIATFMTIRKILENWLYWILIDLLYIYLYLSREAHLFALLFIFYCLIAIFGFFHWRKKYSGQKPLN